MRLHETIQKRVAQLGFAGAICVVFAALAGCQAPAVRDINERLTSPEIARKKVPDATYIVEPPDVIRVVIDGEPALTTEAQVRQDGRVSFPHVPDQKVAGLTTEEIEVLLAETYSQYLVTPKVHATVTAYRSKHIFVYGEVGRNGSLPYTGAQTVADALGAVGGITRRAAPRRARVVRGDISDPEIFWVNLNSLIVEGNLSQNVSLAQNDVVYVPPNVFAWLGYQMDNLLFPFRGILGVGSAALSTQALIDP